MNFDPTSTIVWVNTDSLAGLKVRQVIFGAYIITNYMNIDSRYSRLTLLKKYFCPLRSNTNIRDKTF